MYGYRQGCYGRRRIGASVVVKGTTNGTITGLDGDQSRQYLNVLRVLRAMDKEMESLDEDMRAQNQGYVAAAHVLRDVYKRQDHRRLFHHP